MLNCLFSISVCVLGIVLGSEMSKTWPCFSWRQEDWLVENNFNSGPCPQEALAPLFLPRQQQGGGLVRSMRAEQRGLG